MLIIISLLIFAVLNGYELIVRTQAKKLNQEFIDIQTFIYSYQDRFRSLPGDDTKANERFVGGVVASNVALSGNAIINGAWDSENSADESFLIWQHLRLAGIAGGETSFGSEIERQQYIPRNILGGRLGVQGVHAFILSGITDMGTQNAVVVCSDEISGKLAKMMEISMDDGHTHSGSIRAIQRGSMPGLSVLTAAVVDDTQYTVCMGF
ncbi:MAG: prepilin-type cleavage/methylation domain-containing protein [Nitrosomonadales bacterium]|nr:prepilin-type cleavage/methylation domain-containing protein [Nitrosomonadales bacterium]